VERKKKIIINPYGGARTTRRDDGHDETYKGDRMTEHERVGDIGQARAGGSSVWHKIPSIRGVFACIE